MLIRNGSEISLLLLYRFNCKTVLIYVVKDGLYGINWLFLVYSVERRWIYEGGIF